MASRESSKRAKRGLKGFFLTNAFGILASRILGFIRDAMQAALLGTSIYSDIFFIAFKFPNMFRRVVSEGAFVQSFLPFFLSAKHKGAFSVSLFFIFSFVILILSLLVMIGAPFITQILALGYDSTRIELAIPLVRIHFWYLILIFIVTYLSTLLQYKNIFWVNAYNTLLLNLCMIIAMMPYSFTHVDEGRLYEIALFLSYSVLVGGVCQILLHFYPLYASRIWLMQYVGFLRLKMWLVRGGVVSLRNKDSLLNAKNDNHKKEYRHEVNQCALNHAESILSHVESIARHVERSETSLNSQQNIDSKEKQNLDSKNTKLSISKKDYNVSSMESSLDSNTPPQSTLPQVQGVGISYADSQKEVLKNQYCKTQKDSSPLAQNDIRSQNDDSTVMLSVSETSLQNLDSKNIQKDSSPLDRNHKKTQKRNILKLLADIKAFFKAFFPAMLGASSLQIIAIIDSSMITLLPDSTGGVSIINYANRIFQLPLALFAIALSTALFPTIAKAIKDKNELLALRHLKNAFWFLLIALCLCTLGAVMLSNEIIWLLFERKNFTRSDTLEVSLALCGYMIGLVPYGLAKILSLWLYSHKRQGVAAKISVISLGGGTALMACFIIYMRYVEGDSILWDYRYFIITLCSSLAGFVLLFFSIAEFGFRQFLAIINHRKFMILLIFLLLLEFALLKIFRLFFFIS